MLGTPGTPTGSGTPPPAIAVWNDGFSASTNGSASMHASER